MAQVRQVVSEALQSTVRRLLPSQQGFTEDLQASNVIMPIIDLTPSAEGSLLGTDLQTAWDFSTGHATVSNGTSTLINNTGFWRVDLVLSVGDNTSAAFNGNVSMTDGLTSKPIWEFNMVPNSANGATFIAEQGFVVFLRAGDSLTGNTSNTSSQLDISWRQIADVNGNVTNPLGFVSQ